MDFRPFLFVAFLLEVQESLAVTRKLTRVKRHWFPSKDPNGTVHYPNARYKDVTPKPVILKPTDVLFFLWTRNNLQQYQILNPDRIMDVNKTYFSSSHPTVVIAHGFTEDGLNVYSQNMKNEFFKLGDYNIISVDWGQGAAAPWYGSAVKNVKVTGERTGSLLELLVKLGVTHDRLHLVGFSLGAHVVGIAGNRLKSGSGSVARITGLDPAYPGFQDTPLEDRLDPSDAEFVEVIHTNGGKLIEGGLSFIDKLGHADFYPNGGRHQPGCGSEISDILSGGCSHSRAPQYFIESINSQVGFRGCPCADWDTFQNGKCDCNSTVTYMGEPCPESATGKFFLHTKDTPPFAIGYQKIGTSQT